jgi:uncharacterized protein (TIGR03086 family)
MTVGDGVGGAGHPVGVRLDDLTHAQTALAALLERLDVEDWSRASPCEEWDVAAVVRHLVVGERAFTQSLGGTPYDLADLTAQVQEVRNADLPAAYAEGAVRLRDALAAADPDAAYPTGVGPMPAPVVERLRTVEALVHGWDAAEGAGQLLEVDDAVAERAIADSRELLGQLPPDRRPFAPPVDVAPSARAIDRLAALLGRDPHA